MMTPSRDDDSRRSSTSSWRKSPLVVGGALLLALTAACAPRATLTRSHGQAYAEAFGRQTVNPTPAKTDGRATQGLDSQEAAAVARSYRRSLNAREGGGDPAAPQMVLTGPGATPSGGYGYLPPPSVPSGQ